MVITFFLFIYLLFSFFVFLPSFSLFIFPSYTFTDSPHPLLLCLQNTPPWVTRPRRGPAHTGSTASGCTSLSSPRPHQARGSASWRLTPRGTTPCLLPWQLSWCNVGGCLDHPFPWLSPLGYLYSIAATLDAPGFASINLTLNIFIVYWFMRSQLVCFIFLAIFA
jgi:hypothetical protein